MSEFDAQRTQHRLEDHCYFEATGFCTHPDTKGWLHCQCHVELPCDWCKVKDKLRQDFEKQNAYPSPQTSN